MLKTLLQWIKGIFNRPPTIPPPSFAVPTGRDPIFLGESASRLLENVAFKAAIEDIQKQYFEMWRNSKPMQVKEREDLWKAMRAIVDFEIKMQGYMNRMHLEKRRQEDTKLQKK